MLLEDEEEGGPMDEIVKETIDELFGLLRAGGHDGGELIGRLLSDGDDAEGGS